MIYRISRARYESKRRHSYAGPAADLFTAEEIAWHREQAPDWEGEFWCLLGGESGTALVLCNRVEDPVPNPRFTAGAMVTVTDRGGFLFGCAGRVTAVDGEDITVDLRLHRIQTVPDSLLVPLDPSRMWTGERVRVTAGRHAGEDGTVRSTRRGWARVQLDSLPSGFGPHGDAAILVDQSELRRLDIT